MLRRIRDRKNRKKHNQPPQSEEVFSDHSDDDYDVELETRKLVLSIMSSEIHKTYLLHRIVRAEIVDIDDKDLLVFDREIHEQSKQFQWMDTDEAYKYFGLLLKESLSKENLFKFICLCISNEFNLNSGNTAFRNTTFVKKYLQTEFGTKDRFPEIPEDAKMYACFILKELKKYLPDEMERNPQSTFLNFLHFNFFTHTPEYERKLEAEFKSGKPPILDSTTPNCNKVFREIETMQPPVFASSERNMLGIPFFSKSRPAKRTENPGMLPLEIFYKKFPMDNGDYPELKPGQIQAEHRLLKYIVPDYQNMEDADLERIALMVKVLIEQKYQLSKNSLSEQFIDALMTTYEQIKKNKNKSWYRKGPLSSQTHIQTENLFKKLKEVDTKERSDCLIAYLEDPENMHRDLVKLLKQIFDDQDLVPSNHATFKRRSND